MNTIEFIKKCVEVHGNNYDYSKIEYIGSKIKVCVICNKHGEYYIRPDSFLKGCGCVKCSHDKYRKTLDQFIQEATNIHGKIYNYSEVSFNNIYDYVSIICPIHGNFNQIIKSHLNGHGCPKCANKRLGEIQTKTNEQFIIEANIKHNNKYKYNNTNYIGSNIKVEITCPIHGNFTQTPASHLNGNGCPKCSNLEKGAFRRLSKDMFIDRCKIKHKNKYDYSLVNYINNSTNVKIICSDHGEFMQRPNHHLNGHGCPMCNDSKLEMKVKAYLNENNVEFIQQKTFIWLKNKNDLYLDFYLPKYNIAIECQGIQHFKIGGWNDQKSLQGIIKRDELKLKLCTENNVKIYYFSDLKIKYPYDVITDLDVLLKNIMLL